MTRHDPTSTARLEIDLAAIAANYRHMRSITADGAQVSAVVKSDAYGLGIEPVAAALAGAGCATFFVANVSEGRRVRAILPEAVIIALRADMPADNVPLRRAALFPVINSIDDLAAVDADRPYVLNVDTGFSRLGIAAVDLDASAVSGRLHRHPPRLVMTHLGCSDFPHDPMNELQRRRFAEIRARLPGVPASLAASAGVWLGESYHLDMVRIGSALYGLNNASVSPCPLRPVIRFSARILEVATVEAGETVGYAAAFRTARRSRIAVAGLGYAQGLPWSCVGKLHARLPGCAAPVVGRISMEYVTIDVTDLPDAASLKGAWVDFVDQRFTAEDLASAAGVSPQEILVRLGAAAPRCHVGLAESTARRRGRPSSRRWMGARPIARKPWIPHRAASKRRSADAADVSL